MNDGVNPSSIEEHRQADDDRSGATERTGAKPSPTADRTDAGQPTLADPGSADQPAEGGREQEEGGEDFGSKPA